MHAHHHSAGHSHHGHSHAPRSGHGRAFAIGIVLNLGFVAIEAVYGFWADSMALLSDAGHNLSDVLGLAIAWGAALLARRGRDGALHLRPALELDPRGAFQRAAPAGGGRAASSGNPSSA